MKQSFRHVITCASVALAVLCASAQNTQQGTTHDHPLSDEQTKQYLEDYLGIYELGENNWVYPRVDNSLFLPYTVSVGDVIFVEVNDYWKGTAWSGTPSLYDQVKYGIKSINKVSQSATIGNGSLYHFDATTNRFFFAICTDGPYTGIGTWKNIGTYEGETYYQFNETSPYKLLFRWYNEFSAISNRNDRWDDIKPSFDTMKDGDFLPVPHSCSNSLEMNHFTCLYDKETTDETYSVSAVLFLPDATNATTNSKNVDYTGSSVPYIFFYVNKLAGNRVASTSTESNSGYDINLNWTTSFDKAKDKGIAITKWGSTTGGIKEESFVYRKIEGRDNEFELVDIVDGLIEKKNWTDTSLPSPGEQGYNVTYYVVTKAFTYDGKGNRRDEVFLTAVTNQVTFHIPGNDRFFELKITNLFNSNFTPVADNCHESYNLITNSVSALPTEYTPKLEKIKANDKFVLYRDLSGKGTNPVKTLVINSIEGNNYNYTLNGEDGSATFGSIDDLLKLAGNYEDEVKAVPGEDYDVSYHLVYTASDNTYNSNIVTAQGKRTEVKVEKLYRSGTPDPANNAKEELYTVEVKFKPIMSDDIAYYYLWRNAKERVIRVDWNSTTNAFTLVDKDANGNFNVNLGTVKPDNDGYIVLKLDNSVSGKVREGELGTGKSLPDDDLFFTVEVCATGGNTYGNYDRTSPFVGEDGELVLNPSGKFYTGEAVRKGEYVAEVTWDKLVTEDNAPDGDYVGQEPDYYTVHRWIVGDENGYQPITKYYRGHNDVEKEDGTVEKGEYVLFDQTTDGSAYRFTPEFIEQEKSKQGYFHVPDAFGKIDFVANESMAFPALYYVTAHYDSHFVESTPSSSARKAAGNVPDAKRNYAEKNSNVLKAQNVVVTAASDINMDNVASVTYYTIMGQPVANPSRGEIVVAYYRYHNGTTSARVVKM